MSCLMDLDPIGGFLDASQPPLIALPKSIGAEWIKWEELALRLPELTERNELRDVICGSEMPTLKSSQLDEFDVEVVKRIYAIFSYIAHSYIRGRGPHVDEPLKVLPFKIASIWMKVAEILDVPPITTYASTILYNWKLGDPSHVPFDPANLQVLFSYTGSADERWFFMISAAIDSHSRKLIDAMLTILEAHGEEKDDFENVIFRELEKIQSFIKDITKVLDRMPERCRPDYFYSKLRCYFAGWYNDHSLGSEGLTYEVQPGEFVKFNLAGGSAAQNASIQLLDILLGVQHEKMSGEYLDQIRKYIPPSHRNFLNEMQAKFRGDLLSKIQASRAYLECVEALALFRRHHLQIVSEYIVLPAKQCREKGQGTGGTSPMVFLKSCYDDTKQCNKPNGD